MNQKELTESDYVTIRKALLAYTDHLNSTAKYVPEISDWLEKVSAVQHKVTSILIDNKNQT